MKLLVSSMGRCGSTMLVDKLPIRPKRFQINVEGSIKDGLTKSHCDAPNMIDGKAIYLVILMK